MSKPYPALRRFVASLDDIRRMTKPELRAKTCASCSTTYVTVGHADTCREWHRAQR